MKRTQESDLRRGKELTVELVRPVLVVVAILAAVLLFTPYEAVLEGVLAFGMVAAVLAGFLMRQKKEVYYVRTSVALIDADRNRFLEHDLLAVKVELVRLWLLFVPTALAVASLVFLAAGGSTDFSFLNWIFSTRYVPFAVLVLQYPPMLVLLIIAAWIDERWMMRDVEACSATSFSISRAQFGRAGRVSYQFRGERGEYYGGDCFCLYLGPVRSSELATIVFYNVRKPESNKITMALLFHRLSVSGRGLTDLDAQRADVRTVLAENAF